MKTTPIMALGVFAAAVAVAIGVWQWRANHRHGFAPGDLSNRTGAGRAPEAPGAVNRGGASRLPANVTLLRASPETLRAALAAHESAEAVLWPDEEIIRLVTELPDRRAAFELLKAAAQNPASVAPEGKDRATVDVVRMRAIHALQYLAMDVPEARPFLWGVFQADDVAAKSDAFSTLQSIGFAPSDLPLLVDSLAAPLRSPGLVRYVPQAIARLLAQSPANFLAATASLEHLLGSKDESVRFTAACALAGTHVDRDERVARILREALRPANAARALASAEALANSGPKAAALAPALIDLAAQTPEDYLRVEYVRAAATIRPNLVRERPELSALLAQDAEARQLGQRLEADSISLDDLIKALRFQQYAGLAAFRLMEMGPVARRAVPALVKALHGQDEETRDDIGEALNEIAPETKIERIAAATVAEALLNAERTLGARATTEQDQVTRLIADARKFATWWTREEAVDFGVKLSSMDAAAYNAYATRLIQSHPDLAAPAAR